MFVEKNEELTRQYYKRVSNFAKEMLIEPVVINVERRDQSCDIDGKPFK